MMTQAYFWREGEHNILTDEVQGPPEQLKEYNRVQAFNGLVRRFENACERDGSCGPAYPLDVQCLKQMSTHAEQCQAKAIYEKREKEDWNGANSLAIGAALVTVAATLF